MPTVLSSAPAPAGWLRWIDSGDMIGCMMERRSTGSMQPLIETTTLWTDRAALFDPTATRVEATFSSSYAAPWPKWMEMGDRPGHMLWHSGGRKLRSLHDLPPGFTARAAKLAPAVLDGNPRS